MSYENHYQQGNNKNGVYSKRLKAGKRRTYFFDVRTTRANDYFLTITESKKRFDDNGYERHKIFLYKEDFNKFIEALGEAIDYVKTELLPDFDFDQFSHEEQNEDAATTEYVTESTENVQAETLDTDTQQPEVETESEAATADNEVEKPSFVNEQVDKW